MQAQTGVAHAAPARFTNSLQPARRRPVSHDGNPTPLVVVSPFDEDFLMLLEILQPSDWAVYWTLNYKDAIQVLRSESVPVALCERELPEGDWRSFAAEAQSLSQPPRIIVTAAHTDEGLWLEALNLGAHDVLRKPFDAAEVIRIVSCARQFWNATHRERRQNGKPSRDV